MYLWHFWQPIKRLWILEQATWEGMKKKRKKPESLSYSIVEENITFVSSILKLKKKVIKK